VNSSTHQISPELRFYRAATDCDCVPLVALCVTRPQVRNLCLGLAARGVDWRAQGGRGSLEILGRLVVRLFGNLFTRSEKISQVRAEAGWVEACRGVWLRSSWVVVAPRMQAPCTVGWGGGVDGRHCPRPVCLLRAQIMAKAQQSSTAIYCSKSTNHVCGLLPLHLLLLLPPGHGCAWLPGP
jgi:hypothetical protein